MYGFTASLTAASESGLCAVGDSMSQKQRLRVLHKVIGFLAGRLHEHELKLFVVEAKGLFEWKCVPLLIFYYCDLPECKSMSPAQYDVAV